MNARGYTAVELIITISVMGVLLVLAFVNLTSSQLRARDEERKSDVETVSRYLETYYSGGSDDGRTLGQYPPVAMLATETSVRTALRDVDIEVFRAPGVSAPTLSVIPATNAVSGVGSVTPAPTNAQYVYQPLAWNGSDWVLCNGALECRKYALYYRLEADATIYMIESKNQ